jgi:NitT/TauT family transport system substrate-binding protein
MRPRALAWIAVLVIVLAGAGPAPAAHAAEKVTLRLDWSYWGGHAPFFVAVEKGFFARRGLEVAVQDGKGSRITATVVGEGKDDFGFADSSTVATVISQGVAAKVIAVIMGKNPNGIVFLEGMEIRRPKDLEGKTVGTSPGGSDFTLLNAFLTRNNVDMSKVKLEKMPGDAKPAALLARKVDGISSQGFYNMPILEAQGAKPRELLFADFGLSGLNYGLLTSKKMIKERPDTVRRFLAATLEGWDYAIKNTDEAIGILKKHVPLVDVNVSRQQFINTQKLLRTKNTEGKPLGWQSAEDWKDTLDVLEKHAGMTGRLPLEEYFTNEFVERQ